MGIFLAMLSSLSLALMVQLDRIMVGKCYNFRPRLAWHVSALGGVAFGLPLTLVLGWHLDEQYFSLVSEAASTGSAFWLFGAGIISIQVLKYYFELFIPHHEEKGMNKEAREEARELNATAITMWLATTPLWVFVVLQGASYLGYATLQATNIHFTAPLILMSVGAIVIFESLGKQVSLVVSKKLAVLGMIACVVGYSIILDTVLDEKSLLETLVLQPFFWFGYALGARDLLFRSGRAEWRSAKRRLRYFFKVILVAEFFGALVFYFEVLAYFELGATAINLISAGAILPTFLLSILLGGSTVAAWAYSRAQVKQRYLGVLVDPQSLPTNEVTGPKFGWILIVTGLLVLTITTLQL